MGLPTRSPATASSLQVAVAADGSIALAGLSTRKDANNVSHSGLIVGHLTADGQADPGFGIDGTGLVIRYDQDPYPSYGYLSLCIDPRRQHFGRPCGRWHEPGARLPDAVYHRLIEYFDRQRS